VHRFVEKPTAEVAAQLIRERAVWNSFIFAARGQTLLELFRHRLPGVAERMLVEVIRARTLGSSHLGLAHFYETLAECDFSADLLMNCPIPLRVVTAGPCGWSDLGTPERVGHAVGRLARGASSALARPAKPMGRLSLASALMNAQR
jgi:mannose-1-phosphate guanylyltransferase